MNQDMRDALYDGCIHAWNIWCKDHKEHATEERLERLINGVWFVAQKVLATPKKPAPVVSKPEPCQCGEATGVACSRQVPKEKLVRCLFQRSQEAAQELLLAPECAKYLEQLSNVCKRKPAECVAPESNRRPTD